MNNIHKNYEYLRQAIQMISNIEYDRNILFIALGSEGTPEKYGRAEINFIPYQTEPSKVAKYYQASDIYIHAAKAEVWGLTITEALACGIPVVATDVGGIKEQIINGVTGFLTPQSDYIDMVKKIDQLIKDSDIRKKIGANASQDARLRFDVNRMVDDYLNLYTEIINDPRYNQALSPFLQYNKA